MAPGQSGMKRSGFFLPPWATGLPSNRLAHRINMNQWQKWWFLDTFQIPPMECRAAGGTNESLKKTLAKIPSSRSACSTPLTDGNMATWVRASWRASAHLSVHRRRSETRSRGAFRWAGLMRKLWEIWRFGDLRIWCLGMTIWEFIFAGNLKEVWGSSHWFAECWDSIRMADQS